ncbi:MAG: hypothetical protein COV67_03435 [Nitrospinae bacterium CG11_big_fil_rev_8_21_14_0_20_56_8]|nr:MAG: hypothetical protein COV67_03435 [Nitrospinae bacterium CG11_big_fil_rev_8_21_14_0_20_56_8]
MDGKVWASPPAPSEEKSYQIRVQASPFKQDEIRKYGLRIIQPYSFDLQTLQGNMDQLAYQTKGFGWSDPKKVFHPKLVTQLAPRIVEEFRRVNNVNKVEFAVLTSTGKTYLGGDVFLAQDGLHWRILSMKYTPRPVGDFSISGETWRLVPHGGQQYKSIERFKNLVQEITNWVVDGQVRPERNRVLPAHTVPETPLPATEGGQRPSIKERLKQLEELKSDGLISESEYEKKRQEILSEL